MNGKNIPPSDSDLAFINGNAFINQNLLNWNFHNGEKVNGATQFTFGMEGLYEKWAILHRQMARISEGVIG